MRAVAAGLAVASLDGAHDKKSCMFRMIALAGAIAVASCSPGNSAGNAGGSGSAPEPAAAPPAPDAAVAAPPAKPATALEQVQRQAPSGSKVAPASIQVPGVELFVVSDGKPPAEGESAVTALVGVAGGAVVDGRDLMKAVVAAKPAPADLARIALQAAQRDSDGNVLDAATTREQHKARVGAPAIHGDALVFWVATTDEPRVLERGTLVLSTGAFELEPQLPHPRAVANAIATLAGGGISRYPGAIKLLAASCAEPAARQALVVALRNHPRDRSRADIAASIHKCGGAAVDPLIQAMQHDRSAMVRSEAASALGRTGDPRARPALAKAARSDDANLAWAAKNALAKLN